MSGRNIIAASSSTNSSASNSFSGCPNNNNGRSKSAAAAPDSSAEGASKIRISIDLVAAARRHLAFIRSIAGSPLLHHPSASRYSIRRYEQIWMPMMAGLSSESSSVPMLLPPPDVDWVWLCHCLDPERYREYCVSRFGKLVDRPVILDEENEEYAADHCREIWNLRHPSEPFDLEIDGDNPSDDASISDDSSSRGIFTVVAKHRELYSFFSNPFVLETVYLVSARKRYLNFLHLLKKSAAESFWIVPATDIRLMWYTHQVKVFLKGKREENESHNVSQKFLRMRTVRCHKELKLDNYSYESSLEQWRKMWHLYCEFGTRGIVIEVCQRGRSCLRNNKLLKRVYFYWNDLLHSAKLTLVRELEFEVRALASLAPPVQAAYLLKSVPDCVTDDTGSMISDVILRMNHYRPQEGRWLSRTVLDHAGRECFVIRTRYGVLEERS